MANSGKPKKTPKASKLAEKEILTSQATARFSGGLSHRFIDITPR